MHCHSVWNDSGVLTLSQEKNSHPQQDETDSSGSWPPTPCLPPSVPSSTNGYAKTCLSKLNSNYVSCHYTRDASSHCCRWLGNRERNVPSRQLRGYQGLAVGTIVRGQVALLRWGVCWTNEHRRSCAALAWLRLYGLTCGIGRARALVSKRDKR